MKENLQTPPEVVFNGLKMIEPRISVVLANLDMGKNIPNALDTRVKRG